MHNRSIDRRGFLQLASAAATPMQSGDPFQPIRNLLSGTEPLTWLFTGDSITHGALHTMGWRSYPEHFAERVRWELRRVRDIVINTGISGDRMSRMLPDAEWRVYRFRPQVVSLMMGMNDCVEGPSGRDGYRRNLDRFLSELRDRGSLLLVHTPNPIFSPDPAKERRGDLAAYAGILREFAAANKLPLVDHYQHWKDTRKDSNELLYLLSDGSVHPNQYGHAELAIVLFKRLGIFDSSSRTCRMFVP
jgi:acyl-CoA thioesterase-1